MIAPWPAVARPFLFCAFGIPVELEGGVGSLFSGSDLPWCGEWDAADVDSLAQMLYGVVDFVEPIATGDELIELERPRFIHGQQHRHAGSWIHSAVQQPFEGLAALNEVDE